MGDLCAGSSLKFCLAEISSFGGREGPSQTPKFLPALHPPISLATEVLIAPLVRINFGAAKEMGGRREGRSFGV